MQPFNRLAGVLAVLALLALPAAAQNRFPYQGRLERDGIALNGLFDFQFRLFSTAAGGTATWNESHAGIVVSAGAFSVDLGSATTLPDTALDAPELFLEVSVKRNTEVAFASLGRHRLLHVPLARGGRGDFRVLGVLTGGDPSNPSARLSVFGPALDGGLTSLEVATAGLRLSVDGDDLDTASRLNLQRTSKGATRLGGALLVGDGGISVAGPAIVGALTAERIVSGAAVSNPFVWDRLFQFTGPAVNSRIVIPLTPGAYRAYRVYMSGDYVVSEQEDDEVVPLELIPNENVAPFLNYQSAVSKNADSANPSTANNGFFLVQRVAQNSGPFQIGLPNGNFTCEWTVQDGAPKMHSGRGFCVYSNGQQHASYGGNGMGTTGGNNVPPLSSLTVLMQSFTAGQTFNATVTVWGIKN